MTNGMALGGAGFGNGDSDDRCLTEGARVGKGVALSGSSLQERQWGGGILIPEGERLDVEATAPIGIVLARCCSFADATL